MSVTANGHGAPDVATVLKRVDDRLARKAGDDPLPQETLNEFADAIRRQIVEPLTTATAKPAPDPAATAELDQLRAELRQARDTIRELGTARDSFRDDAQRALGTVAELTTQLQAASAETKRLADELAVTPEAPTAGAEKPHRHLYPLDGPDALPGPCSCGRAFPWSEPPVEWPDEPAEPPNAWAGLFGRIRRELTGWEGEEAASG